MLKGDGQQSKPAGSADGEKEGSGDAKPDQKGSSRPSSPVSQPSEEQEKGGLADHITEQMHHIVIPSYGAWFDYNRLEYLDSINCIR